MYDVSGPSQGVVSPDGASLYFTWGVTGVTQVWKVDGPRRFPMQLTGGEDTHVPRRHHPRRRAAHRAARSEGRGEPGPLPPEPLAAARSRKCSTSPACRRSAQRIERLDGTCTLLPRERQQARRLCRSTAVDIARRGESRSRLRSGGPVARSAISGATAGSCCARRRDRSTAEFWEWDPAKQALTPLFGQGEKEEYDVEYGADDGEILVLTNKLGEFRRLYAFKAGKFTAHHAGDEVRRRGLRRRPEAHAHRLHGQRERLHAPRTRSTRRPRSPSRSPRCPTRTTSASARRTPDGASRRIGVDDGRHPLQALRARLGAPASSRRGTRRARPRSTRRSSPRGEARAVPGARRDEDPRLRAPTPGSAGSDPCPVVVAFHGGPEGQARPGFSVTRADVRRRGVRLRRAERARQRRLRQGVVSRRRRAEAPRHHHRHRGRRRNGRGRGSRRDGKAPEGRASTGAATAATRCSWA